MSDGEVSEVIAEPGPLLSMREDFRATSDPALQESAERGTAELLDYRALYSLWERQQWAVGDLDFSEDRIDWHERIGAEERYARMYGLSSFFVGEQRVAADGVLRPKWIDESEEDAEIFGVRVSETRAFAASALQRRLKVIGLG